MRPAADRRAAIAQGAALGLTAVVVWWLARNTSVSLAQRGLTLGFGFLGHPANFEIGDTWWLSFSPADSIGRAILVGLLNTALVSALGCVLAIIVGFIAGILRLSPNPALRGLIRAAVEIVRNTPLLLLLLFLAASLHELPPPQHALTPLHGVFLSDRGLVLPAMTIGGWTIVLAAATVIALALRRRLGGWIAPAVLGVATLVSAAVHPPAVAVAQLRGFNFAGGVTLSPELAALLAALVLHQSAHISEVVRGAVLAVPRGQRDAAGALGMSRWQTLRLVVMPVALRAMVPLLATNCVSLIKNSSLAVAIGFPDVVSILNTAGNQTGHSIETMLIMIAVYLSLSLLVAAALGRYNAHLLRTGSALS
ncbi:MAG TPA: ABC transporter permease subunit [Gemmatimonadaceae bacterium]|nr:ABC transporter permease subunit [Gemmatimonadaceae bacterium]